jgi:hypothetical protein
MLPFVLSALSDAIVALGRISGFLTAEELPEPHKIEYGRAAAVEVDGDFTWETVPSTVMQAAHGKKSGAGGKDGAKGRRKANGKEKSKKGTKKDILPTSTQDTTSDDESKDEGEETKDSKMKDEPETEDEKPFELNKLRMIVPKGAFVGIVGRVGSGKVMLSCFKDCLETDSMTEFHPSSVDWRDEKEEWQGLYAQSLCQFIF